MTLITVNLASFCFASRAARVNDGCSSSSRLTWARIFLKRCMIFFVLVDNHWFKPPDATSGVGILLKVDECVALDARSFQSQSRLLGCVVIPVFRSLDQFKG